MSSPAQRALRAESEDDRAGLFGALAVYYLVSPVTEPPVITVTAIRQPKRP
jgi:hypothetical protein